MSEDNKIKGVCGPSHLIRMNITKDKEYEDNQLLADHLSFTNEDFEIMKTKNSDYSSSYDPYLNFKMVEIVGACSAEQAIFARMMDKMMRLATAIGGDDLKVEDESVADTLSDLRNYAVILQSYIKNNS